jgi:hypothetical protein
MFVIPALFATFLTEFAILVAALDTAFAGTVTNELTAFTAEFAAEFAALYAEFAALYAAFAIWDAFAARTVLRDGFRLRFILLDNTIDCYHKKYNSNQLWGIRRYHTCD